MHYQRSSAFIGGLQSDRHRSPTTVWPQMNADKRRFARDLLRLSSYFLDTTLATTLPRRRVEEHPSDLQDALAKHRRARQQADDQERLGSEVVEISRLYEHVLPIEQFQGPLLLGAH